MTAYPPKLLELIEASVTEFFNSIGVVDIGAVTKAQLQADMTNDAFSTSLGFSGEQIKGALVLITEAKLLAATSPQREFKSTLTNEDHADWIGEMSNQIVGALKRRAAGYKVDFLLSTPTVVRGKHLHLSGMQKITPAVLCFTIAGHPVCVQFTAALGEKARFEGEPETTAQAASGDTLFF